MFEDVDYVDFGILVRFIGRSKYLALSSSMPYFFAFLKHLPFFLISLFKFMFIHGRLCQNLMECYLLPVIPSICCVCVCLKFSPNFGV